MSFASVMNSAFQWNYANSSEEKQGMTAESIKKINDRLDKIDKWLANGHDGVVLYQILSGSVRGPDNGQGKSNATNKLRRTCFPVTCRTNNTGMCHNEGVPSVDSGVLGHYASHTGMAIDYLKQIKRGAFAEEPAKPSKA